MHIKVLKIENIEKSIQSGGENQKIIRLDDYNNYLLLSLLFY
jgi:hypothetical protein